jgi:hypothetical protein
VIAKLALLVPATSVEMFTSSVSVPPPCTVEAEGLKLSTVASDAGVPTCTVPLLTSSVVAAPLKSLTTASVSPIDVTVFVLAAVNVIVATWSVPVGPGAGQPTSENAPTLVCPGWGGGRKATLKVEQALAEA